MTGQVDRLSITFQGTTPKIGVVTANGLDHTVSYDNAGNETGYYATRTYSPRNLMNSVTDTSGEGPAHSISYGYDYRGVRVSRTETPTDAGSASRYYFYSPELHLLDSTVDDSHNVWGQSAHIMSAPLAMNREVIWFNGQPVAEFGPPRTPDATGPLSLHHTFDTNTPANNLFYTFTDHLGTPLIQTDPSTAIVWRAEHEPYGNVYLMRKGTRTDQPLRFPGQEAAMTWEGTEENYNVYRWYGSGWGRYTQTDPVGLAGGINVYRYVDDDPLLKLDPDGLIPTIHSPTLPPDDYGYLPAGCSASGWAPAGSQETTTYHRRWKFWYSQTAEMGWGEDSAPLQCNCFYKLDRGINRHEKTEYFKRSVKCQNCVHFNQIAHVTTTTDTLATEIGAASGPNLTQMLFGKIVGEECECPPPPIE